METLHTISTARNKSNIRLRSVLTCVGIVTAVICSLVSMKEIHSVERAEASAPGLMETSKFINANLIVNAASTIWSLRDGIN